VGWWLNTDLRGKHLGAAIGAIGEDDPPTFRVGRLLIERTWSTRHGWDGPADGRPQQRPDFLRAVCSCGWTSRHLDQEDDQFEDLDDPPGAEPEAGDPVAALDFEHTARARWLAHALAATCAAVPEPAADALTILRSHLDQLAALQPLAALSLIAAMREAAAAAEAKAVAFGRGHDTSWEELAAAAGTSRQVLHRKHRGLTPHSGDDLDPLLLPGYQHTGQLPYTVTDTAPEEL
jgi:hypothetical protein